MPQESNPSVAGMTTDDIMNQMEKTGLVPAEAAASNESKETNPTAATITVADTMAEAEKMVLEPIDLPSAPEKIQTFPFDLKHPTMRPHAILGMKTVRIVREKRQLDRKEYQIIGNILKAISSIESFTADNVNTLQSRFIMSCVLGEAPNTRGPYEYPKSFQNVAVANLTRMDQEVEVSEVPDETPPTSAATSPTETSFKRPKVGPAPRRSAIRQQPDVNDPAYQSIMWNITVTDGRTRKYTLTDKSAAISCNKFGHNGVTVGQWFPFRICALNAGAHGATQAGIAGSEKTGAFSIVVSSDYNELDKDYGDTLLYSGSNSAQNEDTANAVMTHATKAMQRSRLDSRPIRVLRTAGGKWRNCPAKGIRYDGLYRIVSEEIAQNAKGGAYVRFELVREAKQPNIDLSRPTPAEKDVFDRLKTSI
ncbi:MAG: hypothetical protein ASARMPRED_006518 [Alectoria sarmentosa]|nr:MAG: hypothetical protein ASARMPRED_006518 [Alectoria sarmentosa]